MRAVVCRQFAPVDRLVVEERPDPVPAPGQVVIAVRAAGVNFVDGLFVQGKYQIKPPLPFTPGSEVAGEVAAAGDGVGSLALGDRVLATTWMGGYASHAEVPAESAVAMPAGLSFGQAAGLVQSYGTALFALTCRTHLAEGEWVLVLGAAGGVGLATIDVATHLGGRVIAAASTDEKLAVARAAGAEAAIALRDRGPQGTGAGDLRRWRGRRGRSGRRPVRRAGPAGAALDGPLRGDRLRRWRHPQAAGQPGAAEQPHGGRRRLGRVDHARSRRQPRSPVRVARTGGRRRHLAGGADLVPAGRGRRLPHRPGRAPPTGKGRAGARKAPEAWHLGDVIHAILFV